MRAWAPDPDIALGLRSQISLDILRALRDAGIEIPYPQRDLHLRTVDPAAGRALAEGVAADRERMPATPSRPG